jgi:hypothetical protein
MAAAIFVGGVQPVRAHGPCDECVKPDAARPGQALVVRYRTFKAVVNPTRRQLTRGPKPYCYGCRLGLWRSRVKGVPAVGLGQWRPPRRTVQLEVPSVPQGRYLIALFDGSEGGTHYTWDFIRIVGARAGKDDDGVEAFGIAAGVVALTTAVSLALRRRARA